MQSNGTPQFVYFRIPKDNEEELKILAQKYRHLRLTGLRLSPEAFSSTLAAESKYSDSRWEQRLAKPELQTFICAVVRSEEASNNPNPDPTSDDLQWIAQITLRGPVSSKDFASSPESGDGSFSQYADDRTNEKWQVLSLYMIPQYRGQGVAKRLCEETLRYLREDRLNASGSRVRNIVARTMIKSDNVTSIALFEKIGFREIGRCTLAEGLKGNGEEIPEDAPGWIFTDRGGTVLMYLIEKH